MTDHPTYHRGMTVNEALWAAGLMDAFDAAARKRDRDSLVSILIRAGFTADQANETTTALLRNPKMYGY